MGGGAGGAGGVGNGVGVVGTIDQLAVESVSDDEPLNRLALAVIILFQDDAPFTVVIVDACVDANKILHNLWCIFNSTCHLDRISLKHFDSDYHTKVRDRLIPVEVGRRLTPVAADALQLSSQSSIVRATGLRRNMDEEVPSKRIHSACLWEHPH